MRLTKPIRLDGSAKALLDELKRKHAPRVQHDLTLSHASEAACMVASDHPEEMDAALVVILSAESGADDGTGANG